MNSRDIEKIYPDYHVNEKPIGRGSYGVVYMAHRRDNKEITAAIKVISIPQDESVIECLKADGHSIEAIEASLEVIKNSCESEICLMKSFQGTQNVVAIEDYRVIKRKEMGYDILIRMELLEPLHLYFKGKKISEKDVVKIGIDICSALELIGNQGFLHRDIKPQNILVNKYGVFKLSDFGIARKLDTVSGFLSQNGSPNYMAPEAFHSKKVDKTLDLYSLGLVLYQFLNEKCLPFVTPNDPITSEERELSLRKRLEGAPLPAPTNASPQMAQVLLCACNYDPRKRFSSAGVMKKYLLKLLDGTYSGISEKDLNLNSDAGTGLIPEATQANTSMAVQDNTLVANPAPVSHNYPDLYKRKFSFTPVIIFVLFVLVLGGIILGPRLFKDNDRESYLSKLFSFEIDSEEKEGAITDNDTSDTKIHTHEENPSDVVTDTVTLYDDTEKINARIEIAESYAGEENYEAAVAEIKEAKDVWPESKILQEKEKDYTDGLSRQVKEKALTESNELASSGEYLKAIQKLEYASSQIGEEDPELNAKTMEYESSYISKKLLPQTDELLEEEKYDAALLGLREAHKSFPQNDTIRNKIDEIERIKPQYLADILVPYYSNDYTAVNHGASVKMGGKTTYHSIIIGVYGWNGHSCACYNLDGNYSVLSGCVGYVDDRSGDGKTFNAEIICDGEVRYSVPVSPQDLPHEFSIDISGVKEIVFKAGDGTGHSGDIAFGEVKLYP